MKQTSLLSAFTGQVFGAVAIIAAFGCAPAPTTEDDADEPVAEQTEALSGSNLSGSNLSGSNLSGMNLSGSNMGGANLSGSNLSGSNLSGNNLSGSNLAGNNLGGQNLSGSNLSGSNLSGSNLSGNNLSGSNLSGSNLSGSNLSGSNLSGSNLSGSNLSGSNLSGSNLSGSNSGANIHDIAGNPEGMLYSREDKWFPPEASGTNSSQRVVMGIGSTAFPRFLSEQTANAKIYVALGKLPWGFSNTAGGAIVLDAWEAVTWGDQTYNVFVLTAPTGTTWGAVAGFIKAIFRWNAPPAQSMDISGIDASAAFDPTVQTSITTYTGMMGAADKYNAAITTPQEHVIGEAVFVAATTNNLGVMVDFSSWVMDSGPNGTKLGQILGNVQSSPLPTGYELAFFALQNADETITIGGFRPDQHMAQPTVIDGVLAVRNAWGAYWGGAGYTQIPGRYRPVPFRCSGYWDMSYVFGIATPPGKCDAGFFYSVGGATYDPSTARLWNTVSGTTAPMNDYMVLPRSSTGPLRRQHSQSWYVPVISETYVHLFETSHAFNRAAGTNTTAATRTSYGSLCAGSSTFGAFDNSATGPAATQWCVTGPPSTSAYKAAMTVVLAPFVAKRYQITANTTDATKDPKDWVF